MNITVSYEPLPRPACAVCGTPAAEHGSYPSCSSHEYAPALARDEWQRRYAARLMERGGMNERAAIQYAPDIYDQTMKDSPGISPEDAADEEMSCWEDTK